MIDINELRIVLARHGTSVLNEDEILELLDRLEAAESDALEQARLNGMGASREAALMAKLEAAEKEAAHIKEVEFPRKVRAVAAGWETKCARIEQERDALRAKIEEMEKQEPAAWCATDETGTVIEALGVNQSRRFDTALYLAPGAQPAPSFADAYQGAMEDVAIWKKRALEAEDLNRKFVAEINGPAYMGEPAQPAPIEQDTFVRKAWVRFSNELHRSHDAPYPGMSEAFEQHFSQSFTDREWRAESATWAAAWKAAKRHGAQPAPSTPEVTDAMAIAFHCALTDVSIGEHEVEEIKKGLRAALEAAPEAKP